MKFLDEIGDLKHKRVFYHPDYSVPLQDGRIVDDYRVTATFPSLDYLISRQAKIIIGTKMGDPKGKFIASLDMRPVAENLADHYEKQAVYLSHEIEGPEIEAAIQDLQAGDMLLLPNLRFYPGEQSGDQVFAEKLAALADLYVNDAFSLNHREDTSITVLPRLLPSFAGFQLREELSHLGDLLEKPEPPFVIIMGGAKVSDKIEVIRRLSKKADRLLIGGAMANTFLLAKGEDIGDSVAEDDKTDLAKELMQELQEKLVLAADYVKDGSSDAHFKYLDIGEQAIKEFKLYLKDAKTIFWNGSLGLAEDPRYARATEEIAKFIANLEGVTSVIAGGDTVEIISKLRLRTRFSFVSTGGGAALAFLAGEKLPGVEALENSIIPQEPQKKETSKPKKTAPLPEGKMLKTEDSTDVAGVT